MDRHHRRDSGIRTGEATLSARLGVLAPDLLYRDGAFHAGVAVEFDEESGRITRMLRREELGGAEVIALPGRALLPGFVNAHSHAFQRLIRGHTQWRPAGDAAADFWSWRDAMYTAALALTPDDVYHVSRFCFIEMLRAGFTAVGEFHYLHRDADGRAYADPLELAWRVIAAAADAGIRIRLLHVAYATGGIGEPLRPEQRRFATPELDRYLAAVADLARATEGHPLASAGVAPHSVRAVPRDWLAPIHELAYGYGLPYHIHVSEQPAEVTACLDAYGVRPVELIAEAGIVDEYLTAVHATHLTRGEVSILAQPGPVVCACPTTERDLGDGFLAGSELIESGARIAIGSDSQTQIAPLEEVRLLEYHERLRRLRRVVLGRVHGEHVDPGPLLLDLATAAGARSLRIPAGALEPGLLADFVAIDLEHEAVAGSSPETLAATLALCAPRDVVCDVWVGGNHRIHHHRHVDARPAAEMFRNAARRVFG